jgi:hypothetical protein
MREAVSIAPQVALNLEYYEIESERHMHEETEISRQDEVCTHR